MLHSQVTSMELSYKLFYFFFYASYMPLLLYLPVYFKYLGLGPAYVGLLNGMRPILQAVGTPFLITIADKFRSRRFLFVISFMITVAKLLVIYLVLRPRHQVCTTIYFSASNHSMVSETSHNVRHMLVKRAIATSALWEWNDAINESVDIQQTSPTNSAGLPAKKRGLPKLSNRHGDTIKAFQISTKPKITGRNLSATAGSHIPRKPKLNTSQRKPSTSSKPYTLEHLVTNEKKEIFHIFTCLLIVILVGDTFETSMFTLVDNSSAANMDTEHNRFIRLMGNLGWGLMTPVIGVVLNHFEVVVCGKTIGSFHYVFFFAIGFLSLALLTALPVDFTSTQADVITRKVQGPAANFQYGMFLFASAFSGFCNGFFLTFVYWFIDSLGGNAVVMGMATACKSVVDITLFFLLAKLIGFVGHQLVVNIGLVGHIAVFFIYFTIKDPWLVVIAEGAHSVFYAAITSTCSSFLSARAPAGSSPKMQVVLHGIYWGLGTGFGSIFGGCYLERSGFLDTFTVMTIITTIVAVVFLILQIQLYISNPEAALEEMWTVWSRTNSNVDSDYEGLASDEELDDD